MGNKWLFIGLGLFIILSMASIGIYNHSRVDTPKAVATIQYSSPIGPIQSEPYILPSHSLITSK